MQVICLQDDAFYALVNKVVARIKATNKVTEDKWISPEEATPNLRDEGRIRFSQPNRKIISIMQIQ